ncbi:hypothetical protein KXV85_006162, partial [Aspergillus fumigatus]
AAVRADSRARRDAGCARAGCRQSHRAFRLRAEAADAHRHGRQRRQPQLGDQRSRGDPAPVAVAGGRARHGVGGDRGQRLSLPRALRHALVRVRQAAAWRNQARRHGQRVLPPPRRPASRCRAESDGAAEAAGNGAPAFAQAAQFCG